jgi:hypothetical protein
VKQGVLLWLAAAAFAATWWLGAYTAGRWLVGLFLR